VLPAVEPALAPAVLEVLPAVEPAVDPAVLDVDPAAGLCGSVTSTYDAPADPESASTAAAASHLASRREVSPK
jgi:hypothetical protein